MGNSAMARSPHSSGWRAWLWGALAALSGPCHLPILRKLSAYPRQNSLAVGLRELGRIERTLFTLKWLQDPALRRRVSAGLNKGEARNSLARAVFFKPLFGDSAYVRPRACVST